MPAPAPYANFTNPQTLNLYAIARDNPETFADLDGHCGPGGAVASAGGTGPVTSTTCGPTARGTDAEGELGNSGIANASCSVYSCDNASDVASQGSQVAAQMRLNSRTNGLTQQVAKNGVVTLAAVGILAHRAKKVSVGSTWAVTTWEHLGKMWWRCMTGK